MLPLSLSALDEQRTAVFFEAIDSLAGAREPATIESFARRIDHAGSRDDVVNRFFFFSESIFFSATFASVGGGVNTSERRNVLSVFGQAAAGVIEAPILQAVRIKCGRPSVASLDCGLLVSFGGGRAESNLVTQTDGSGLEHSPPRPGIFVSNMFYILRGVIPR